jgi:hypothetical protein
MISGYVTAAGLALLVWDLLTLGAGETRLARVLVREAEESSGAAQADLPGRK